MIAETKYSIYFVKTLDITIPPNYGKDLVL